jgi:hypothetical protein
MSSAVHLLTVRDSGGQRRQAVLRRYVRPGDSAGEPGIAEYEARALHAAGPAGVPTPELLAVDPAGAEAGVSAVLMSRLPGRVDWWPSDVEFWLRRLAGILPHIHAAPVPPAGVLRPFAPDPQASYRPPGWARYPRVWERAAEIGHAPLPRLPAVLVHRDFHPGNVLWQRGAVAGVVDWQSASTGPAVADVAHCRANLLGFGTASDRAAPSPCSMMLILSVLSGDCESESMVCGSTTALLRLVQRRPALGQRGQQDTRGGRVRVLLVLGDGIGDGDGRGHLLQAGTAGGAPGHDVWLRRAVVSSCRACRAPW